MARQTFTLPEGFTLSGVIGFTGSVPVNPRLLADPDQSTVFDSLSIFSSPSTARLELSLSGSDLSDAWETGGTLMVSRGGVSWLSEPWGSRDTAEPYRTSTGQISNADAEALRFAVGDIEVTVDDLAIEGFVETGEAAVSGSLRAGPLVGAVETGEAAVSGSLRAGPLVGAVETGEAAVSGSLRIGSAIAGFVDTEAIAVAGQLRAPLHFDPIVLDPVAIVGDLRDSLRLTAGVDLGETVVSGALAQPPTTGDVRLEGVGVSGELFVAGAPGRIYGVIAKPRPGSVVFDLEFDAKGRGARLQYQIEGGDWMDVP